MKRIVYFLAIGLTVAMAFAACQKNDLVTPTPKGSIATSNNSPVRTLNANYGQVVYCGYISAGVCFGLGNNCGIIPPITIVGKRKMLYDAQDQGAAEVASVFKSTNFSQLCDSLSPTEVEKLQSGNYVIKITADNDQYITFIAQKGSQVSDSNFDFAVQLTN